MLCTKNQVKQLQKSGNVTVTNRNRIIITYINEGDAVSWIQWNVLDHLRVSLGSYSNSLESSRRINKRRNFGFFTTLIESRALSCIVKYSTTNTLTLRSHLNLYLIRFVYPLLHTPYAIPHTLYIRLYTLYYIFYTLYLMP